MLHVTPGGTPVSTLLHLLMVTQPPASPPPCRPAAVITPGAPPPAWPQGWASLGVILCCSSVAASIKAHIWVVGGDMTGASFVVDTQPHPSPLSASEQMPPLPPATFHLERLSRASSLLLPP